MLKLSSLLLIAMTAGLTALALNGARPVSRPAGSEAQQADVDAWFI